MNLEKELIKQNRKIATPKELLLIKESEKFKGSPKVDTLSRIGLETNIKEGKAIKARINAKKAQAARFDPERVFHISQIEKICKQYCLRFLPSHLFRGNVDEQTPIKVSTFELAHSVFCTKENTFIVAPAESFELQEDPKDPLLFYMINDEYYYLIHKWGKDLHWSRGFNNSIVSIICCLFIQTLICFAFLYAVTREINAITVITSIIAGAWCNIRLMSGNNSENWNKPIK